MTAKINIHIECEPSELGGVLDDIRAGFLSRVGGIVSTGLRAPAETLAKGEKSEATTTVVGLPSEPAASTAGQEGEKPVRTRRTKAQIAADEAAAKAALDAKVDAAETATDVKAALVESNVPADDDETLQLFGGGDDAPDAQTFQSATFEDVHNEFQALIKLGVNFKTAQAGMKTIVDKYKAANVRELTGEQRGEVLVYLTQLRPS